MKAAKEIYEWLKKQNYQTEIGEQEYRMYYDVDMPKILEQYHESRMKEELIEAFNWLSDKDSPYVPLYDEYNEKGIRFVTNEADYTSEQVVNSYLASRKQLTPPLQSQAIQ